MALSEDQKKYLVLGTVGGVFAIFVGSMMFGGRKASAAPMLGPAGARPAAPGHHDKPRTKRRHNDDGSESDDERDHDHGHDDNGRGEYGRKKKHHHKGHRHGD